MASAHIEHKLALLPDLPGCYLMKNLNSQIIYVGKAKNLKNRVRSYFKSSHTGKTARLVSEIKDFEFIVTSTDKEAFLLEITLIQKHQPYFNIKLKKGTGYPYIKITSERDPRILIVSDVRKDGGYYFGPYPNVYAAQETVNFIQKVYPLRRCNGFQHRPCLYYHMGQCLGACFKTVPTEEYDAQIKRIKSFLNGHVATVKQQLTKRMETAAADLEFERAAELRDQLTYIEMTVEKQKIISNDNTPRDLFNFYLDKGWLSIQVFFIRQARLMKREKRLFPVVSTANEEMTSFILQFYNRKNNVLPREVLVPDGLDKKVLSDILGIPVRTPQRGQKKDLLDMAHKNARIVLEEKFRLLELDERKTTGAMQELTDALGLPPGHKIEAFDHSHIQGTDLVSAMVVFTDGQPNKKLYRKYKLRTVDHADEAASTREVIRRRYTRLLKEHAALPDLILMDGGDIQLDAAKDVLENELGLDTPVAAMVKNDHHKTADLLMAAGDQHLNLDPKSQGFYLLQRIQDEVHRFAITFHRQVHTKHSLSSRLDEIPGVGPKTRNKLLRKFGSMTKIAAAPVEDIQKLGIAKNVAQTIKFSLAGAGVTPKHYQKGAT
ncbi:excinuclease ABC subunit UvrC [Lactiplantibacillus mudanjiangensis]|uniref:UvrABC system protein C n=1 Tax=Lactiplantibacillus mudanjiangensis TaxID=1296538 RepID=A0A660E485_9LACO|nr:excinuclease ABC subunit UvrC [Lactiplantibacillus mudanjiangensis]VDG20706.1 excinuclease ABC subunit C [Lactobacillus plantarum JDM1] [Lactiplantibacillus mudanjiangensis]VDG23902.1 excinuclease ABC subunit C [Lactobacillus plantarum JDM1] [Lactiplantibacillus mudanjiangensis]VDG30132.1 excinuclease ABC subunit C [Lactobacillus plantarum JDM1] [Lactiplantibacillus mudanjiangensis]VDG30616.1 excinuclease ABC subunit C [Lactobacillus plantarum JDM1] [Lactiplantibacillus mudanjiangensis]